MLKINARIEGEKQMRQMLRQINREFGGDRTAPKGANKALWAVVLATQDGLVEAARQKVPIGKTGRLRKSLQKRTFEGRDGPRVAIGYKYRGRGQRRGVHLRQVVAAEYPVRQGGPFAEALQHIVNTYPPRIRARAFKEAKRQIEKSARRAQQRFSPERRRRRLGLA